MSYIIKIEPGHAPCLERVTSFSPGSFWKQFIPDNAKLLRAYKQITAKHPGLYIMVREDYKSLSLPLNKDALLLCKTSIRRIRGVAILVIWEPPHLRPMTEAEAADIRDTIETLAEIEFEDSEDPEELHDVEYDYRTPAIEDHADPTPELTPEQHEIKLLEAAAEIMGEEQIIDRLLLSFSELSRALLLYKSAAGEKLLREDDSTMEECKRRISFSRGELLVNLNLLATMVEDDGIEEYISFRLLCDKYKLDASYTRLENETL